MYICRLDAWDLSFSTTTSVIAILAIYELTKPPEVTADTNNGDGQCPYGGPRFGVNFPVTQHFPVELQAVVGVFRGRCALW